MKIAIIGGGSYSWAMGLVNDFLLNDFFRDSEICLMDINPIALENIYQLCCRLNEMSGNVIKISKTADVRIALNDAQYVIPAVSIGGMDATIQDHKIGRKYALPNLKGHDIGPAGFSRLMRHVPFMLNLAHMMEKYCQRGMLLNVTNPLVGNTMSINRYTGIKAYGFCHGVVNHLSVLLPVLDAKSMDEVDFVTAGIDHCSWLLDLKVKGKNGFEILRQKKIVEKAYRNEILATVDDRYAGMEEQRLRFVIWDMLGYLPAIGDLHICEFFPYFFKTEELRKYWSLHYDRLIERPKTIKAAQERAEALLNCQKPLEVEPSGEIVANFISALNGRGEFIEVLNTPNIGQISNLPIGAIVETKCLINSNGVQPISVGTLPALLESIVRPALLCEMMYMEAVYEWDKRKAIAALCIDPVAGDFRYISQMVDEYFALNETVLEKLGIKINSWK